MRTETQLDPEELQAVLNDAIARQGQAERQSEAPLVGSTVSTDEALAIARDLNIPQEHVLDAIQARRQTTVTAHRRDLLREGRKKSFQSGVVAAVVISVLAAIAGLFLGGPGLLPLIATFALAPWLFVFFLGWRWLKSGIADEEVRRTDIPVAGTCRVCGKPAYNERATFCAEHQWKGPGGS